jgi:hypothetical protein
MHNALKWVLSIVNRLQGYSALTIIIAQSKSLKLAGAG